MTIVEKEQGTDRTTLRRVAWAEKVSDQFTASFEGGSNYWLQDAALMKADVHPTGRPWYSCPEVFEGAFEIALEFDNPNGYEGNGAGRKTITEVDVQKGLELSRSGSPNREADADTADVFLQCCLFGKVVYG